MLVPEDVAFFNELLTANEYHWVVSNVMVHIMFMIFHVCLFHVVVQYIQVVASMEWSHK